MNSQWSYQIHWWEMRKQRFVRFSVKSLWALAGLRSVWKPACYLVDQILGLCADLCAMFSFLLMPQCFLIFCFVLQIDKVKRVGSLEMFVHLLTSKEIMCECSLCGHKVSLYSVYAVWHSDSSTFLDRSALHMPKKFSTQQNICEYT